MRKIIFFVLTIISIACLAVSCGDGRQIQTVDTEIYYADIALNRLLPYKTEIPDGEIADMANAAIDKLIGGRENNKKIRRLIPSTPGMLSVKIEENVAHVNLSSQIADNVPHSRDIERLIVYQIVDTLTVLKGIRFVKFTVDNEVKKDFMGFMDMREVYKYTYPE